MGRAAVVIGVDRAAGRAPLLKDAAAGAEAVATWARGDGFDDVAVLTDADGATVEVKHIKRAIARIVEQGTTEQLLVYFAGHGINKGYGEYWLLSEAPTDTNEAVNVESSGVLARYCGIPHVVFVSDACRTAPESIDALRVTGAEIFPGDGVDGLESPVDVFYATTLGRAAHEIKDRDQSAKAFKAVYTQALVEALLGQHHELFEWARENGTTVGYLRPRPLKAHLQKEVPRRIQAARLQHRVIQLPDARIASDEDAWLTRRQAGGDGTSPPPDKGPPDPGALAFGAQLPGPEEFSHLLVRSALDYPSRSLSDTLGHFTSAGDDRLAEIAADVAIASTPFGPMHHETGCGFKVRGASFAEAVVHPERGRAEVVDDADIRMYVNGPGTTVLLKFTDRTGAVVPAIAGFITALTVDSGELVDVAYEPSEFHDRAQAYAENAEIIRTLRAIAASSTRNGVFRLERDDALELARRMQYAKSIDPSLAVYAAYAYHDLGRRDLIQEMADYLYYDLGAELFDVAMLAGRLGHEARPRGAVLPALPLLSQGWALLPAYRIDLPEALRDIQDHLLPSVWTLFDPLGAARVAEAVNSGTL